MVGGDSEGRKLVDGLEHVQWRKALRRRGVGAWRDGGGAGRWEGPTGAGRGGSREGGVQGALPSVCGRNLL